MSYTRRDFLKVVGASALMASGAGDLFAEEERRLVRFPEKTDLILVTSRPPQLETPVKYFMELVTRNQALFVRWHLSVIPTSIDVSRWRLRISGHTEKDLELSLDDLKTFEKVTYAAVIQCSGNGRSFFDPRIPGGQWQHGSMGNVMWAGARLKDILHRAGIKADSIAVAFDGLDEGPLPTVHDYVKSLPMEKAMEEDVLVAYEMNGEPLPMLHGFPARLVVPGWYATYWVKALSKITVLPKAYDGYWMKTAYRIPDTPCACVPPWSQPSRTVPNTRMNTKSVIVHPGNGAALEVNRDIETMGIAFSGGYPIREVTVSLDRGKTWETARLGRDLGRYSWIQWFHSWRPDEPGRYTIMAKATNSIGESQPFESLWNPAGYMWNKVEGVEVIVGKEDK
jgi:sulfoxide reductase catalytic subunit YedY